MAGRMRDQAWCPRRWPAWLLVAADGATPTARCRRAFLAMVVRLVVVVVLGVAAALGGTFARTPLLFWWRPSYVALLPLEVRLAIRSGTRRLDRPLRMTVQAPEQSGIMRQAENPARTHRPASADRTAGSSRPADAERRRHALFGSDRDAPACRRAAGALLPLLVRKRRGAQGVDALVASGSANASRRSASTCGRKSSSRRCTSTRIASSSTSGACSSSC